MPAHATLQTLLDRHYSDFLRHQLGRRPKTEKAYLRHTTEAIRFVSQQIGRSALVRDFTTANLQGFLVAELQRGLKPQTVGYKKAALVTFSRLLRRRGLLHGDPTAELLLPKPIERIPRFLTKEEAEALVAAPLHCAAGPIQAVRDHAIQWLLYEGGIRAAEAAGLQLDGLFFDNPQPGMMLIRVLGKGQKERLIPLRSAINPLQAWLERRHELAVGGESSVFLAMGGGTFTTAAVTNLVSRYARKLGVKAHAHSFRHTCATLMLLNGAELRAVQEFLGHADIRTTQRYAHTTLKHLIDQALDHHPASGLAYRGQRDELLEMRERLKMISAGVEALQQQLAVAGTAELLRKAA